MGADLMFVYVLCRMYRKSDRYRASDRYGPSTYRFGDRRKRGRSLTRTRRFYAASTSRRSVDSTVAVRRSRSVDRRRPRILRELGGLDLGMFRQIGFPRQRFVLMRTVFLGVVPPSTGAVQELVFAANSINDPFLTAASVRPTTYVEWNTFYNRYRVHGAKMSAWLYAYEDPDVPNSNSGTMVSSLTCTPNTMAGWTSSDLFASGLANIREWQPDGNETGFHTNIGQMKYLQKRPHFTATFSAKQYFQIKDVKDQEDMVALFNADPTSIANFRYNWVHFGVAPTGNSHQVRYELDQIVELIDPKMSTVDPTP